jgi:hypothetical protein
MNTLGAAGYALEFDGVTDWVQLQTTLTMMGPGWESNKTVNLWVRPMGTSPACTDAGRCEAVFSDSPRWWGISRGVIGGQDKLWVWNHDGSTKAIAVDYTVNQWTHVTLVHTGGVLRAFRNGVEVGSVASGPTQQPVTGTLPILQIGGVITSGNFTFRGQIDEVAIWNRGRAAEEVSRDVHRIHGPAETGLIAYYRMSNGSGTSLRDDSVNSWTGTFRDGAAGVPGSGQYAQWVVSTAPVTRPPTAQNQTVITDQGTPVALTLVGSDPDGDPITFRITDGPAYGSLGGTAPHVLYTPDPDFYGTDLFRFRVGDGLLESEEANVTIVVNKVNRPPVAVDDAAVTLVATPVLVRVLVNDYDLDGDPLTVTAAGPSSNGTVENLGEAVRYTPNPGFLGTDRFNYTVSDGQGGEATGLVTVSVKETNTAPTAHSQATATQTNTAVAIVLTGFDPDGDPLTFLLTSQPVHGSLSGTAPQLLYTPGVNFQGTDRFRFLVSDGVADSAEAEVAVTVAPPNNPPVAVDDSAATVQGTPVVISVLANDYDPDGDPLSVVAVGSASNGTVENLGHAVRYTSHPDFVGGDGFSYSVSDGRGGVATAWVTVTVTPDVGPAGYALEFNGITDYVRVGNTTSIMGGVDWVSRKTISVWVRAADSAPPAVRPESGELIAGGDRPRLFGISRALWGGEDKFWAFNVSSAGVSFVGVAASPGEWMQITLVHADGVLRIYRNGVEAGLVASGPTQTQDGASVGTLYLGGSDSDRTRRFSGRLDEVRFWNVGLDDATVKEGVYRKVATDHPRRRPWKLVPRERSNLTAYYRMTDGQGTVLTDDGPYQNVAALLGGMGDHSWVASGAFGEPADPTAFEGGSTSRRSESGTTDPRTPSRDGASQSPSDRPRRVIDWGRPNPTPMESSIIPSRFLTSPTAVDDRVVTPRATPVLIRVLDNDQTGGGAPPALVAVGTANHGTTENLGDAVRYIPHPDFVGVDVFSYLVSDEYGGTAGASVEVTVTDRLILDEVGALSIPGEAREVAVVGGFAYVAAGDAGLRIVDVSDPVNPVEVGSWNTSGSTHAVRIADQHAFLSDGSHGMRIVNVTDPASPYVVGGIDAVGPIRTLAVALPYVYLVGERGDLVVADVTDKSDPTTVGFLATSGRTADIALSGDVAYLADSDGGLRIVDVSDPAHPFEWAVQTFSTGPLGLALEGRHLYLAAGRLGLRVLDVSDPVEAFEVAVRGDIGFADRIGTMGGYAFVADGFDALRVIDVFDPSRPFWTATLRIAGPVRGAVYSSGYGYLAAGHAGLRIIRVY